MLHKLTSRQHLSLKTFRLFLFSACLCHTSAWCYTTRKNCKKKKKKEKHTEKKQVTGAGDHEAKTPTHHNLFAVEKKHIGREIILQ